MLRCLALVSISLLGLLITGCEHMQDLFKSKKPLVDVDAKRPGDNRVFRSITLDNKLTALLISDPQLNKSAAALDVHVGSLANPEEHAGLSHFLEHMLFLGTEKYPAVEEYSQYLAKFQGESNAFTDEEDTNYYFSVNHEGFEGALDRFSQFFIAPLFNPEYVERELHAVNSEHEKNLKNDSWRIRRVFEVLHKAGHPRQKFGTGSLETLKNVDKQTLIAYYKKHYSANLMKLVMMSPAPLDQLEKLAREKFSAVPNYDYKKLVYDSEIFDESQLPRIVKIKSIKKLHKIELSFATPTERPFWKSKPATAITYILGYEGHGSLLSLLKKEGLATRLEAGVESSSFAGSFHFDIELTDKGVKEWKQVLRYFYAYVEMMNKEGYKKYLYNERKTMADIDYFYREPQEGGGVASDYAMKMQTYADPLNIDKDDRLIHEYNESEYKRFLSYIRPEKMNMFFVSDDVTTDQTEKFYGVAYKVESVDKDLMSSLQNTHFDTRMMLPQANPYIPEKLEILSSSGESHPTKLIDNEWGSFWFQVDDTFKIPKASIRLVLINEKTNSSPYHKMMAQLYSESINESLNEWAYTISLAGLHIDLSQSDRGIQIDVSGYSDKIPQALEELSKKLTDITIDEETFDDIKTELKRKIANTLLNSAYWQTLYELKYVSNKTMVHNFEFYNPMDKKGIDLITPVKFTDVKAYAKDLYTDIAIEGAAYGSLDAKKLKNSVERFASVYSSKILPQGKRPKEEILVYPSGRDLAIVRQSKTNNNSWGSYIQFGRRELKLNAALRVGHAHLQTSFYTDLRTKQQLGYIVASNLMINEKVLGLLFLVQSANFSPFDIAQRANRWMEDAVRELENLKDEEINAYKEAVAQELREKDKTIQEKLENLYFEANIMKGHFHYKEDLAKEALKLTKQDVVDLYKNALVGPKKASLSVYYTTEKATMDKPLGTVLENVKAFKENTPIYE